MTLAQAGLPAYGDLATGITAFSTRWARHNVRFHRSATKTLHSQLVRGIELSGESLEIPGDRLTVIAYIGEPGSPAQEQLNFLASWSAGPLRPAPADTHADAGAPPPPTSPPASPS